MSPTSVLFLAFMVVVSGLVAYWGDLIGRHFGKRRLTLFGMRPRHTAALFTGLFGAIAAALAIGSAFALSEPVRRWMVEGDRARQELANLKADLEESSKQLKEQGDQLKGTKEELSSERTRLKSAQKQVKDSKAVAEELKRLSGSLKTDLARFRQSLATTRSEVIKLSGKSKSLEQDVKRRQQNINAQTDQLKIYAQQFVQYEKDLQARQKDLDKKAAEVNGLESRLKDLTGLYKENQSLLSSQRAQFDTEIGALRNAIERARQDLEEAQNDLRGLQQFKDITYASLTKPLILSRGDELARLALPASMTLAEARNSVLAVMREASSFAKSRGAGTLASSNEFAGFPELQDAKGSPISPQKQIDELSSALVGKPYEQLLVANAFLNSFEGVFVPLTVTAKKNPVVYRDDEIIAEFVVDGRKEEQLILASISAFVRDSLAPKALRDGMVPAVGRAEPLGEISVDQVLAIVRQVREVGRPIRLQFLAAQQTRAGDPLQIQFRLR